MTLINNADQEKKEIMDNLFKEIQNKLPAQTAKHLSQFVEQFYRMTSIDDLRDRNILDLYGSVLSFWHFVEEREKGETKIRVYNPQYEQHGWQSTHTVVELILDDCPFLIDSISMEINRLGLTLHFIVHLGNLKLKRDAKGVVTEIMPQDTPAGTGILEEAPIYIEIDRQTDANTLQEIEVNLQRILKDVRNAVSDWQAMRSEVQTALNEISKYAKKNEDLAESKDFLDWIIHDQFTFLGYCQYDLKADQHKLTLEAVSGSYLGLLRDAQRFPLKFTSNSPELVRFSKSKHLLTMTKVGIKSTVHRPTYMDLIAIKRFNAKGEEVGEHWVLGLYTASAYNTSPLHIPFLRTKIKQVIEKSGIQSNSHAGRTILNILETLPRDDVFHADVDTLLRLTMGIYQMHERQQIRMFAIPNPNGQFLSCLVYVPRERFSTVLRKSMQETLAKELQAEEILFSTRFSDSVLARLHFVLKLDPHKKLDYDLKEIENRLIEIGRSWQDELHECLVEYYGEEKGNQLYLRYAQAFSSGYREIFSARTAIYDIRHLEYVIEGKPLEMNFYRPLDDAGSMLRLKLYKLDEGMPLSDILPVLENMGLRVLSERPYRITLGDGRYAWINDFGMGYHNSNEVDVVAVKDIFQDAFAHIWFGLAENDGFNKLVLAVGFNWREISVLRAYCKYLRQLNFSLSQAYIEQTLVSYPHITRDLIELFNWRFNPKFSPTDSQSEAQKLETNILAELDKVMSLDEDRILRRYLDLIKATQRTNYFQVDAEGKPKEYISFKLNPQQIADAPLPRPKSEFFVYHTRFEGVHLTAENPVKRGGIRWSDRREDFRWEVLGLMKTQEVKNAQIVPGGAKGGFVAKCLPVDGDREAILAEGIACYKNFIRGLLDITDNIISGEVQPPQNVVRYDSDDPYLVVAADKGTATFSNIANAISLEYDYWLGDAFASGGSTGYDHKKMGITARGGLESVKRHLRELGIDIRDKGTYITSIMIGDMSGDVAGNFVKHFTRPESKSKEEDIVVKLVAAFDGRYIYLNPNPDPVATNKELMRLQNTPNTSWADFDTKYLSKGGGIYKRTEKSIRLSPEVKELLAIDQDVLPPNDIIRAILKSTVDLIWNGGIGTFVKSLEESHIDIGDRTNDAIRVNAEDLRCRVVGEGGNLGFTQRARREYAMRGGKIYTDFIDNSAGVDCSDHEVNIKILLNTVVTAGDLTVKQRNELLASMTDEVAKLVLDDNYHQTQAISIASKYAPLHVDLHNRYIDYLEQIGKIDRAVECLPDSKALMEKRILTPPDIAVLMSYTKLLIKQEILKSDVPEDPAFTDFVEAEFPKPLCQQFRKQMEQHRLRREIIATQIVNRMINEMGFTFAYRLHDETGASTPAIVRAFIVARAIFDLNGLWQDIEALDNKINASAQMDMMLEVIRLLRRTTRWFLRNRRMRLDVALTIEQFKPCVEALYHALPKILCGEDLEHYQKILANYKQMGVSDSLAQRLASLRALQSSLDIIEASVNYGFNIEDVASLYYELGNQLELGWIRSQVIERVVENHWESLSREALRDDLDWQQKQLAVSVLAQEEAISKPCEEKFKFWQVKYRELIERWHYMLSELRASPLLSFTMFFVATRELLDLTQTCFQAVNVCGVEHHAATVQTASGELNDPLNPMMGKKGGNGKRTHLRQ